jgi:hypothetical protein
MAEVAARRALSEVRRAMKVGIPVQGCVAFQRRAAVNRRLSIALRSWRRRIALLKAFQRHDRGFETAAYLANVVLAFYAQSTAKLV